VKVLVDTSVWSLALRRQDPAPADEPTRRALADLIGDARVAVIGPIRQELLSGISRAEAFDQLRERLAVFPDQPIRARDYVDAAHLANECRRRGVQGSPTDFLICAVAIANGWEVFAADNDFALYAQHIPVKLHTPPPHPGS
jgi:predicted nucleic acid-binding protein